MKIVKELTENCHFYIRDKLLYVAWACFIIATMSVSYGVARFQAIINNVA